MLAKLSLGVVLIISGISSCLLALLYYGITCLLENSGTILVTEFSWIFRLVLNLIGYGTVLVPLFICYKYVEKTDYFSRINNASTSFRLLSSCFNEPPSIPDSLVKEKSDGDERSPRELVFCFFGLMGAYLVWGLLQEKIMTQNYIMPDGSLVKFSDSQFLVFINRFGALICAALRLYYTRRYTQPVNAPLFKFSFCSLTNITSAWCQYEALKYVNFPTQVLSKSCKIIPVMLMGKVVSGNSYRLYEYATAVAVSFGMVLFMLGSNDKYSVSVVMTLSGLILLALYMVCDSFTSSWQHALFNQYNTSPIQMMCYVNIFSCALPAVALLQNRNTVVSLALLQHPVFLSDCILLSLSSTFGQLLIYRTISMFGAVVFTIIMTLRQAVSILLSCIVYGHSISVSGILGISIVFGAVLFRVYCSQRIKKKKRLANI